MLLIKTFQVNYLFRFFLYVLPKERNNYDYSVFTGERTFFCSWYRLLVDS